MLRHGWVIGLLLVTAIVGGASASASSVNANIIMGTNGPDVIVATSERDIIYAKSGDDEISDVGDGDLVYAGSGNDTISTLPFTTVHDVRIQGNLGHDTIDGRAVNSYVNAGSGNDHVDFDGCRNHIVAGTGNDSHENTATCFSADRGVVSMGNGHDVARVRNARNISLGNGNDVVDAHFAETVHAGSGNDFVELELGSPENGGSGVVFLGAGRDRLRIVNTGGATVYGSSGADHVFAGHSGDNVINTQSGDDVIEIGDENVDNRLDGGPGRDLARLSEDSSGTTCRNIERVTDLEGNPRSCS